MKFIIFNLKYKMLNCNIQKIDTLDMTVGNKSFFTGIWQDYFE